MQSADAIIKKLQLIPHPEGGYYKEHYRSKESIPKAALGNQYNGNRNYSTSIYFMLTSDTFSAFHKINQDEIWHFYDGSPIILHSIDANGKHSEVIIGSDLTKGQVPQYIVAGGDWFAAKVLAEDSYALLGCTVAPGFDFADFELAKQDELIALFPQHQSLIKDFTR